MISSVLFRATAQEFTPNISKSQVEIGDKTVTGWSTRFPFTVKKVEREFWRYCKDFSHPKNQKQFYRITIPSSENEGNTDIILFSKAIPDKDEMTLFIGLHKEGLSNGNIDKYNGQIKTVLIDFKRSFYLNWLEDQIKTLRNKAKKLSRQYKRSVRKGGSEERQALQALENLKVIEARIEEYRQMQFNINQG